MEDTAPQMTNLIDLLNALVLPFEPDPIPMMPQTWGWVLLGLCLAVLLGWAVWTWHVHRREHTYRRAALTMLRDSDDDPARIAEILRRTALVAYPRTQVAGLAGQDWLAFLDRTAGNGRFGSEGASVAIAPYRAMPPDPTLTRLAEHWVRHHKRRAQP